MQFGAFMRDEARDRGADALQVDMLFDQKAILEVGYWGCLVGYGVWDVMVLLFMNYCV